MKTELAALTISHLEAFGEHDPTRNALRLSGPGFCLLAEREPVAAGGIACLGLRRGVAWVLLTRRAHDSALLMRQIHRHVKTQFPLVRAALGFEQVDAEADETNPQACAWLEYFGFKKKPIVMYSWGK